MRHARRHLDRHQGHGDPGREAASSSTRRNSEVREIEDQYNKGLITDGERYNKVVDIWAEVTDRIADEMLRELGTEEVHGRAGREAQRMPSLQPDLHDGRLRRPRLGAADPAARRHARPDGEAVGRDHRDADHGELPRRAHRAPVLHLDARRPQGSRRHGAQDGELRLPHAPARRRRAGLDHHRAGLRHARRHRDDAARRGRRDHRRPRRPRPRARRARGHPRSVHRRGHRHAERRDRRGQGRARSRTRASSG